MKFTKNELNLMRYAMYDLLNGDDIPNDKDKFETHVNGIIDKIDGMLGCTSPPSAPESKPYRNNTSLT